MIFIYKIKIIYLITKLNYTVVCDTLYLCFREPMAAGANGPNGLFCYNI